MAVLGYTHYPVHIKGQINKYQTILPEMSKLLNDITHRITALSIITRGSGKPLITLTTEHNEVTFTSSTNSDLIKINQNFYHFSLFYFRIHNACVVSACETNLVSYDLYFNKCYTKMLKSTDSTHLNFWKVAHKADYSEWFSQNMVLRS